MPAQQPFRFSFSSSATRRAVRLVQASVLTLVFCAIILPQPSEAFQADSSDDVRWLTGGQVDSAIPRALSTSWTGLPLGQRLAVEARRNNICVFVDRRIDTQIPVDFNVVNVSFEQMLWRLADSLSNVGSRPQKFGVCRVGDVFYFGPEQTAKILPVLIELLNRESETKPALEGAPWATRKKLAWPELSGTRELIQNLCDENGISIANPELLQHDLWSSRSLPTSTSLRDRLALLLIGFEQVYFRSEDGKWIKIIEVPELESGPQRIPVVGNANRIARNLRDEYPELNPVAEGRAILVDGPVDSVYALRRKLVDDVELTGLSDLALQRFTLNTGGAVHPRKEIVEFIARQAGMKAEIDPAVVEILESAAPIQLDVTDQRLSELIALVVGDLPLTFTIGEGTIRVAPK